ncbi:MAG TPA: SigE family RNA polymerase sigma factor [Mycobacteriales bacterium]|nr:SigE family RNA polymerase sigma factor [Mycobacteriales bacterium]
MTRNEDGFAEFVQARLLPLTRFAYLICGDRNAAQDLVQTALTRTMLRWSKIDQGRAEAYVRTAIVNEQRMAWRRRWRGERPTLELPEVIGADAFARVDQLDALQRALAGLPVRQRAAVVLRYLDDMTEAQAAEVLQCSVGTVKSQTSRGLSRLRALLSDADAQEDEPIVRIAT